METEAVPLLLGSAAMHASRPARQLQQCGEEEGQARLGACAMKAVQNNDGYGSSESYMMVDSDSNDDDDDEALPS